MMYCGVLKLIFVETIQIVSDFLCFKF